MINTNVETAGNVFFYKSSYISQEIKMQKLFLVSPGTAVVASEL